jgi:GTP-binding protein
VAYRVLLLGRPNVGKSTLFNSLVPGGRAITGPTAGVTRDVKEGRSPSGERIFYDTPGSTPRDMTSPFLKEIWDEADLFLFVIDGRVGLTQEDHAWAKALRKSSKPVLVVVNKCDRCVLPENMPEGFWEAHTMGFHHVVPVSAAHGTGLDLLDEALEALMTPKIKQQSAENIEQDGIKGTEEELEPQGEPKGESESAPLDEDASPVGPVHLALVGRPNVGKSTLMNRLLGRARVQTGPVAGLTRDAIVAPFNLDGKPALLWDTAGLRRRSLDKDALDKASETDTLRAIHFAHVVVLLMDGTSPFEKADLKVASHIIEEGRGIVLAVNKCDKVDVAALKKEVTEALESLLPKIRGAMPVFLSAETGTGVPDLLRAVKLCYTRWQTRLSTGRLNHMLQTMIQHHPPPLHKGRSISLKYIVQTKARPPTFALFGNRLEGLPASYETYLLNKIRTHFHLEGVPLRLSLKRVRNPYDR